MPIWDHLDELRERVLLAALAAAVAVAGCFCFSKDLVVFLEAPVADQGVRFLQLSPGEFFFTTLKVAGYAGLLLATPTVLYEIVAYVVPGLTRSERRLLAPIIFGSGILFYAGLVFSYEVLTPAALNFFVSYAEGAVESLWSIDQYFEFVLVLMLSTGEFFILFFCLFDLFLIFGESRERERRGAAGNLPTALTLFRTKRFDFSSIPPKPKKKLRSCLPGPRDPTAVGPGAARDLEGHALAVALGRRRRDGRRGGADALDGPVHADAARGAAGGPVHGRGAGGQGDRGKQGGRGGGGGGAGLR